MEHFPYTVQRTSKASLCVSISNPLYQLLLLITAWFAGHRYFALKRGSICLLPSGTAVGAGLDVLTQNGPSSECSYPCPGDSSQLCGGFYEFNLWSVDYSGEWVQAARVQRHASIGDVQAQGGARRQLCGAWPKFAF